MHYVIDQVSSLQDAVTAVHEPLKGTASRESNGGLDVGDVMQLQRENQELEQQIAEKNKVGMAGKASCIDCYIMYLVKCFFFYIYI